MLGNNTKTMTIAHNPADWIPNPQMIMAMGRIELCLKSRMSVISLFFEQVELYSALRNQVNFNLTPTTTGK